MNDVLLATGSGHTRGDIRDAFLESLDSDKPDLALAGRLWNCTDILPSQYCSLLELPSGSTYAMAARVARRMAA